MSKYWGIAPSKDSFIIVCTEVIFYFQQHSRHRFKMRDFTTIKHIHYRRFKTNLNLALNNISIFDLETQYFNSSMSQNVTSFSTPDPSKAT